MATLPHPPLKTWTRAEIEAVEAAGLLAGRRYELIEGEVYDKMGQNPPHASAIAALQYLLAAIFGVGCLRTQLPVEPSAADAPSSLPVPDVVVTRESYLAYRERHPGPADVVLVAEVADSSVLFDTKRKASLYARAGFADYVVVDLAHREVLVFRDPRDDNYRSVSVLHSGEDFIPLAAPQSRIPVAALLLVA